MGKVFASEQLPNTLLFYQIEPLKNGASLILPSSIAKNSLALNAKTIFEILILEGRTNSARPSRPCLKNCQNGTSYEFLAMLEGKIREAPFSKGSI